MKCTIFAEIRRVQEPTVFKIFFQVGKAEFLFQINQAQNDKLVAQYKFVTFS